MVTSGSHGRSEQEENHYEAPEVRNSFSLVGVLDKNDSTQ